jgi:hypothetical protein
MNGNISTFVRRLLIAVLPVALLAMSAQPALAAHYGIDGSNPYATGCANTGVPVFSAWTGSGILTLKFSNGCVTAWAEFTCRSTNGCTFFTLWAQRNDGSTSTIWMTWPQSVPNGATVYSGQLFDAGALATRACYQGYFGAPKFCTWAY